MTITHLTSVHPPRWAPWCFRPRSGDRPGPLAGIDCPDCWRWLTTPAGQAFAASWGRIDGPPLDPATVAEQDPDAPGHNERLAAWRANRDLGDAAVALDRLVMLDPYEAQMHFWHCELCVLCGATITLRVHATEVIEWVTCPACLELCVALNSPAGRPPASDTPARPRVAPPGRPGQLPLWEAPCAA
jgi:hypothetical protein